MGQLTSNISIYIPAAGETNYDQSFAAGMINIDQHDHSGGPTHGVPIGTAGIVDGSITYAKLNSNVFSTGTFTPILALGGGSVAMTFTTNIGKYWKIGNVIFFTINIVLSALGSSTGSATITGLPFTSANDTYTNIISGEIEPGTSYPASTNYGIGKIAPMSTIISLFAVGPAAETAFADTNFSNTGKIYLSGFYWVA